MKPIKTFSFKDVNGGFYISIPQVILQEVRPEPKTEFLITFNPQTHILTLTSKPSKLYKQTREAIEIIKKEKRIKVWELLFRIKSSITQSYKIKNEFLTKYNNLVKLEFDLESGKEYWMPVEEQL